MTKQTKLGAMFLAFGGLLILHHYVFWRRLYDLRDMLHHEFFEAVFFTAGVTLLLTHYTNKRGKKRGHPN